MKINVENATSTRVEIYDVLGHVVATLNGASTISWDGRDALGTQLSNGSYIVRVTGVMPDGSQFTSSKQVVIQH